MTIAIVRREPSSSITMEGPASSINSRATAIKTILLAAWRGKLTNEEWELRIRKVLPRGVNGDVYDLADCLLRQALIGPVPNQLFLNYLRHAVSCELVSYSAVLSSISNQPINLRVTSTLLHRTSPIICLLDFLKAFRDRISCKGTEVECLNLCHSLSELIQWLLKCIQQTIEFLIINAPANATLQQTIAAMTNPSTGAVIVPQGGNGANSLMQIDTLMSIIDLCTETIHYFISRPFTKSLLFIDKIEYPNEFNDSIIGLVRSIIQRITTCQQLQFLNDKIQHLNSLHELGMTFTSRDLHPSVVAAKQLDCLQTNRIRSTQNLINGSRSHQIDDSDINHALFNSLYPLVAFDTILRPARLTKHLARQIVTITNFTSAPVHTTYCELIRVCLIGLYGAHGHHSAKAIWAFFTFLKLPRLLIELNRLFDRRLGYSTNRISQQQTSQNSNDPTNSSNFINDLKQAFERLCKYSPLLDEAENRCNCDLYKCLVKELIKNDPSLIQLKNLDFRRHPARRPVHWPTNNSLPGGHMMLKCEPVVTHMIDALNSEQDPVELFSVLCQSCTGISFEYTLSAAAVTGRLHTFVKRLIEHNELYKTPRVNSSPKHELAQALNFDITFLILTYIAQRYSYELIERNPSATFNKWYYECYNQDTCSNCPKEMLKSWDDQVVRSLIKQLVNPNEDIKFRSVNWNAVCFNTPRAVSEILNAWIQDQLSNEDIARVIECLRSKMCFMAVVASNWLQCYIKTLDESDKTKPLYLLNSLSKPSHQSKKQKLSSDIVASDGVANDLKSWGYSERSGLMVAIVKRIYFEIVPSKSGNSKPATGATSSGAHGESDDSQDEMSYHSFKDRFISTLTAREIFSANVKQCLSEGSTDYDSLNSINSLFKIIGSKCFTSLIVNEILTSNESPSDLGRAVNISFGLFHLDIEACAFALIEDVIPEWLLSEKKQILLNQPRAYALADLAAKTIIEAYNNLKDGISNASDHATSNGDGGAQLSSELERKFLSINGIRQGSASVEQKPGSLSTTDPNDLSTCGESNKRIKLMQQELSGVDGDSGLAASNSSQASLGERLDKLNGYIADLMRLFKEIMSEPVMSHRTLFPVLFLEQIVSCAREESTMITVHLKPDILLDVIDLFSSELTFELVLAMSNLSSSHSRKYTAKSVCKLAQLMSANGGSSGGVTDHSSSQFEGFKSGHPGGGASSATPVAGSPMVVDSPSTTAGAGGIQQVAS